ncbi:TetR/AcrR family transcriptional regulator [Crossiella cryophila]|uniref:AcrR family transcriptional regulator n=1 Tax=Crossiella cryophila TaxID=43355 RepID=A0A7W7CF45_9PSEU|nr:TetR/AcrR family transcriptional regulator [Crossiella cryophila]MBB4678633.1 AcrR family transcriptional regulator [Crossiella cryophila]
MAEHRPPSGERAERKRLAIVRAARTAFLREGFEVSMDTIAAAAEVSKVTVYNHFRTKEELFTAVVGAALDEALGEALTLLESGFDGGTTVRADLIRACRAWVGGLSHPDVLALRNLVTGEIRRFPALGEAWLERGPKRFHASITAALTRLVERAELKIPDLDLAALQLSGLVLSPHQVYGAYGPPPGPELTDRLITHGVDMFLSYYG